MIRLILTLLLACSAASAADVPDWVARSDADAGVLLDVMGRFTPEQAAMVGVEDRDTEIMDLAPGYVERSTEAWRDAAARLGQRLAAESHAEVRKDLQILIRYAQQTADGTGLERRYRLPYFDVPQSIFIGINTLLGDQVAAQRRPAALTRLRRYTGMEAGYTPLLELAIDRLREGLTTPGLLFPSRQEVEKHLGTSAYYVQGIADLFRASAIPGYEDAHARLRAQVDAYNKLLRELVLPRARDDFRLPPELYAFYLRQAGIDLPPEELAARARVAWIEIRQQMVALAPLVAREAGLRVSDYRDVLRELKKRQLVGEAILPHYRQRLAEIEVIVRRERLVTLPPQPARIRLASEAESASISAPYLEPPRLIGNQGEMPVFVVPLAVPVSSAGETLQRHEDFTYAAASWPLVVHEARPGHELQFATIVANGTSLARALFAFNSVNVEGWALYAEAEMLPYLPAEGQLATLQYRLLRAGRAFMDPELHLGRITPEEALRLLTDEMVFSGPMAQQEIERYTYRMPGQAPSYYYGYTRLLGLRAQAEFALGQAFDRQRFHDFLLAQGLLPPDLLQQAVTEQFLPAERDRARGAMKPPGP